jgi:predicted enzyme related to lactoylglutathione lyase
MATIVHFELPADDVNRAKGFWEGVFGWSFQGMDGPFEYLMTQGEEPVGAIYPS